MILYMESWFRVCTLAALVAFNNTTNGTIGFALDPAVQERGLGAQSAFVSCDGDVKVAFFEV